MSAERWKEEVEYALSRLEVVKNVERSRSQGHGAQAAVLRIASPGTHWSTFCHWRRCVGMRQGPEWERLLDGRIPPPKKPVDSDVKMAAACLRRADPQMSCEDARDCLAAQFGDRGKVSDSTLGRVWRAHGLNNQDLGDPGRFERVVHYSGGAALALVGAAAAESGLPEALARAAQAAGAARVLEQGEVEVDRPSSDPVPGRDEKGRFTPDYNRAARQGLDEGQRDPRWDADATKRERRELASLSILSLAPETLAQRLLTMGMVPLVSAQRGFDGMDAPRARWVRMLGWRAYRPSTLNKTSSELGVLGVDEALWDAHGQLWAPKAKEWAQGGPGWMQLVRYLDITGDPHWTRHFAKSGKVSRTGRVQPCLQRATLTVGPGVPLRMESVAGTHDLKRALRELLKEDLAAAKPGAEKEPPQWITVVDAEAGARDLLAELVALPRHRFVTVWKRPGASITEKGEWISYRQKDQLCEVEVKLGALVLRGVWMQRSGSRNPHRTLYVTDASTEDLSTVEVADVYLSRWPNQESVFRCARHGAGLEHSHGFTGEFVTHVALEKKQTKADKRVDRLQAELHAARVHELDSQVLTIEVEDPLYGEVAAEAARQASRKAQETEKRYRKALEEKQHQDTMPHEILQRDTTRENAVTCLNLSVMMLVEWVLREYMGGGLRMELQTFLNYFLYLPVQVRTTWHKVRYRIEVNDLSESYVELVRKASEEINRRKIRRDGRLLVFEVFRRPDQDE